ncbi:MAG: hypothetical protein KIS76_08120 [Pyrinomonadaceae bacterium]|nr:hypothetical protein [Pyrinomonadaceae bacterium]
MNCNILTARLIYTCAIVVFTMAAAAAQTVLSPQKVSLKDGKTFMLNLPSEFEIIPAAEGMKRVRFFAKAPDGRIFVTDMFNLTDNSKGKVYILDDFDEETGIFGRIETYLSGLKNPNSIAFLTDEKGQAWFYLAETDKLTRRKFSSGETKPSDSKPETIATFPDYGLSYKYGGWHLTRTVVVGGNGKIYVSVGSSCNSCIEKEPQRASIIEMNPDGSKQRIFAKGLRNAVGVRWIGKNLFATNQGADHLGKNKPDETFYAIKDGADYGWARCYQAGGKIFRDTSIKGGNCRGVPTSYAFFPAHSSAMGFDYFDSETENEIIKDSFLVALHGSTDKRVGRGYKVVIMRKGEKLQDFITGFLKGKTVNGRPLDIFKMSADSFLLSDDHSGVVYFVRKKRTKRDMTEYLDSFRKFIRIFS